MEHPSNIILYFLLICGILAVPVQESDSLGKLVMPIVGLPLHGSMSVGQS